MRKLRWGILSTGTIAKQFAGTAKSMTEELELYGVASRSLDKAEDFAEKYGIPKAYGSYEEMLSDEEVDAVYIATPNQFHYENIVQCLEHGKHVLCEKPFTVNEDQARRAFALAKEKGLFLMEAFWTRFCPLYKELFRLLSQDVIGEVNHISAQYGFIAEGARLERKFLPHLAGGTLLDIGIYAIGFACMMFGYEPEQIFSHMKKNPWGTDESEAVMLCYPEGKTAVLTTAIGTLMPTEAVLFGKKGRIVIDNFRSPERMQVISNQGQITEVKSPFEYTGFEYEIREAVSCILQGKTQSDEMTPEKTMAVLGIMDRLRKDWGLSYPFEEA